MILYVDTDDGTPRQPRWRVTLLFSETAGLVEFQFHRGSRLILERIAHWASGRWAAGRWAPRPPEVPTWLVERVEQRLRDGEG